MSKTKSGEQDEEGRALAALASIPESLRSRRIDRLLRAQEPS